jgi:hypothetical protein
MQTSGVCGFSSLSLFFPSLPPPLSLPTDSSDLSSVHKALVLPESCVSHLLCLGFYGVPHIFLFFLISHPSTIYPAFFTLISPPSPSWCIGLLNGVQSNFWHSINLNFQAWEARLTHWHPDKWVPGEKPTVVIIQEFPETPMGCLPGEVKVPLSLHPL